MSSLKCIPFPLFAQREHGLKFIARCLLFGGHFGKIVFAGRKFIWSQKSEQFSLPIILLSWHIASLTVYMKTGLLLCSSAKRKNVLGDDNKPLMAYLFQCRSDTLVCPGSFFQSGTTDRSSPLQARSFSQKNIHTNIRPRRIYDKCLLMLTKKKRWSCMLSRIRVMKYRR